MTERPQIYRPPRIYRPEEHRDTEPVPRVTAFMTERGSIYTYDESGRTTRHKEKTDETFDTQDLTVFIKMDPHAEEVFTEYIRHNKEDDVKVYVVERQSNDAAMKIRTPEDVSNPDELYLAVCRIDPRARSGHNIVDLIKTRKATLAPELGAYAYDTRRYEREDGRTMTERHLGHKVVAIR